MKKTLTYFIFLAVTFGIIILFVTAKTYAQLSIAVLLYAPLAYFALKILPRRAINSSPLIIKMAPRPVQKAERTSEKNIADIDKRTFVKLIGATGIYVLIFSMLGRRVDSLLFGGAGSSINTGSGVPAGQGTQATAMESYKIAEIDDGVISYYGFVNDTGDWFIMREDTKTSSFRYTKGGNKSFSENWNNRKNLKYDFYYNLF